MPDGPILAVPLRGRQMGDHGNLHGAQGGPGRARRCHSPRIAGEPDCAGWRRRLMSPGTLAGLFFRAKAAAPSPLPIPLAPLARPA
ncbi:MAG: hypothetical protein LW715_13590 [Rhodobacter sp.]|jgi:hypothetical protein|nr:hypothetical protein [Rhodobacter sp.]